MEELRHKVAFEASGAKQANESGEEDLAGAKGSV